MRHIRGLGCWGQFLRRGMQLDRGVASRILMIRVFSLTNIYDINTLLSSARYSLERSNFELLTGSMGSTS